MMNKPNHNSLLCAVSVNKFIGQLPAVQYNGDNLLRVSYIDPVGIVKSYRQMLTDYHSVTHIVDIATHIIVRIS